MLRMDEEVVKGAGEKPPPGQSPLASPTFVPPLPPPTGTPPTPSAKVAWLEGILGCLRPVFGSILPRTSPGQPGMTCDFEDWNIPFEEIKSLQWLGSGAQGAVFSGTLRGAPVAVKKVRDPKETEITHLKKLRHENIVRFHGVCTTPPVFCVVMEFCPYGPLFNLIKNGTRIPPGSVASWAKQIAAGMEYLHDHKIIHRDLKSPNVLISHAQTVKISDFGTSREWNDVSAIMSFAGTLAWMAPEVIRNEMCSEKVDIWSFGVVLWELLTGEIPYREVDNSAIIYGVGSNSLHLPLPASCPDGFKLIVQMCWHTDSRKRPSFKHILMHLDIAAVEILCKTPEDYFQKQESWQQEIRSVLSHMKAQRGALPPPMSSGAEAGLVGRRRRELQHAQDVREHYERKLAIANDLYLELSAAMLQLELREHQVAQKEESLKRQQKQSGGKRGKKSGLIRGGLLKAQQRLASSHTSLLGLSKEADSSSSSCVTPDLLESSPDARKPLYTQMGSNNIPLSTTRRPSSLFVPRRPKSGDFHAAKSRGREAPVEQRAGLRRLYRQQRPSSYSGPANEAGHPQLQRVHSLLQQRSEMVTSSTQTEMNLAASSEAVDHTARPNLGSNPDLASRKLMCSLNTEFKAPNCDTTDNNNEDLQNPAMTNSLLQRSFSPCTCEHCMLCPVAKSIAQLSESNDTNKNLPPSMTTSDTSLPSDAYSVEEALHNLAVVRNNNQLNNSPGSTFSLNHKNPMSWHEGDVRKSVLTDSEEANTNNDNWEVIEKLLSENSNKPLPQPTAGCLGSRSRNHDHNHDHNLDHRRQPLYRHDDELHRSGLEGERQPPGVHHSFFVTAALTRRGEPRPCVGSLEDVGAGGDEGDYDDLSDDDEDYLYDRDEPLSDNEGVEGRSPQPRAMEMPPAGHKLRTYRTSEEIASSELDSSLEDEGEQIMRRDSVLRRPLSRNRQGRVYQRKSPEPSQVALGELYSSEDTRQRLATE